MLIYPLVSRFFRLCLPVRFENDRALLGGEIRFKRLTGTMTDLSWPDQVGTWVGMDGVEYDVVISLEDDNVRKPVVKVAAVVVLLLARVFGSFYFQTLKHPRFRSVGFAR